jgi:hypothetical protein
VDRRLPVLLLIVAGLGWLVWQARGWSRDTSARASNSGKAEVVAIANDAALADQKTKNAELLRQRNEAWQSEEILRAELEAAHEDLAIISQRHGGLESAVPDDLLCLFNQAVAIERGEPAKRCAEAPLSDAPEGDGGDVDQGADPAAPNELGNAPPGTGDGGQRRVLAAAPSTTKSGD